MFTTTTFKSKESNFVLIKNEQGSGGSINRIYCEMSSPISTLSLLYLILIGTFTYRISAFRYRIAYVKSETTVIFTALHGMQTRSCDEISVRLSVRPSVKRVHCDKTEEKSVQIFIPCDRQFSLVFREEEWLEGGRPLLPEILGQPAHVRTKSPILNR